MKPSQSSQQSHPTSVAASTLSMATMLSVVSSAFTRQGASSIVSDSDDDNLSQKSGNGNGKGNVWDEQNLRKSTVKSPRSEKEKPKPLFDHHCSEGAFRDEIEIEFNTKNGKKFTGSITPTEVKHGIYIDILGFPDHENFDGVRIGFKGKLVTTIKLIHPIDIDDLSSVEYFDFIRTSSFRGKKIEETIGCKIRGIRWKQQTTSTLQNQPKEDGRSLVKIEGCDYRVPEDQILEWLSYYGKVESNIEEDYFVDDRETGGNNRTGNYSVLMSLSGDIPQLLPMAGRRVKIYHKGIKKLCTKCFGKHRKSDCKASAKVEWIDYVADFIEENKDIPSGFYGKWTDLVDKHKRGLLGRHVHQPGQSEGPKSGEISPSARGGDFTAPTDSPQLSTQDYNTALEMNTEKESLVPTEEESLVPNEEESLEPTEADFEIPTSAEEYESMFDRFATIGLSRVDLDKVLESRRTAFNKATREFRKKKNVETKNAKKPRKNSLVKK